MSKGIFQTPHCPKAHYSIIPLFHHSLRGVGPTLQPVSPTGWKRGRRPIAGEAN